jgi:hypothetical protein
VGAVSGSDGHRRQVPQVCGGSPQEHARRQYAEGKKSNACDQPGAYFPDPRGDSTTYVRRACVWLFALGNAMSAARRTLLAAVAVALVRSDTPYEVGALLAGAGQEEANQASRRPIRGPFVGRPRRWCWPSKRAQVRPARAQRGRRTCRGPRHSSGKLKRLLHAAVGPFLHAAAMGG